MRIYNVMSPTVLGLYSQETHFDNHKKKEFLVEDTYICRVLKRIKSIGVALDQLQRLPQNDFEHFPRKKNIFSNS
jgi:hypothetical protein